MPIDKTGFIEITTGLKWNRSTKTAIFDVRAPGRRRRYRKVAEYPSIEEALSAFADFRQVVKTGTETLAEQTDTAHAPVGLTFAEFCTTRGDAIWCDAEPTTVWQNRYVLKQYLVPFFGAMQLDAIGELDVRSFKAACRTREPKTLAPATINFALRRLRETLREAKRQRLVEELPPIKFMAEDEIRNEMTPEEQRAFLAAFDDFAGFQRYLREHQSRGSSVTIQTIENDPFRGRRRYGAGMNPESEAAAEFFRRFQQARVWFVTALHTGLRKGDLLELRKGSVRFREGLVTVTMRKTGRAALIPMSNTLSVALTAALERAIPSPTDHVFVTTDGRPYAETVIRRYFAIAKWIAGISRRFRINDLRHTFASNLASAGFSTLVIRDCLGHTTTKQSERYARPDRQMASAVRTALDAIEGSDNVDTQGTPDAE